MPTAPPETRSGEVRTTVDSPLGPLTLVARDGALAEVHYGASAEGRIAPDGVLAEAAAQLAAYFAGARQDFDLPLAPAPTPLAEKVRAAMLAIPAGQTASYADLARTVGSVPRAVGQACRHNPIGIIVPCHRVLASGGRLGGYSGASAGNGGGDSAELSRKRWLLAHEGARLI